MCVWDVHPGYLNRQSLLGEHRELHGIASILSQDKKRPDYQAISAGKYLAINSS